MLYGPQLNRNSSPTYNVGEYVAAIYDGLWYIAQVEGEEEDEEVTGFTLLRYMNRKGHNQFYWDSKPDLLKTNNKDILCKTQPPIPVSSRYVGYPKNVLKNVDTLRLTIFWLIFFILPCVPVVFFHNNCLFP